MTRGERHQSVDLIPLQISRQPLDRLNSNVSNRHMDHKKTCVRGGIFSAIHGGAKNPFGLPDKLIDDLHTAPLTDPPLDPHTKPDLIDPRGVYEGGVLDISDHMFPPFQTPRSFSQPNQVNP